MFIQNFKKENKIQKPNLKIDIFPLPFESRVFWQAKASRMTWDPAELRPKWHESIAEREFKAYNLRIHHHTLGQINQKPD